MNIYYYIIKIYNKMLKINTVSPFHHSQYEFITENSVDIKDEYIQNAEKVLNRAENQIKLNKILYDIEKSIKIELSIFEFSLIYCLNNNLSDNFIKAVYEDKLNSIIANLTDTKNINNKTLKNDLLSNKINPSYVAFMSPAQLHPQKWLYWVKKKEYKEIRENSIVYSDAYKCFKCGERKTKVTQAQTRSADEPMTTFVTCLVCYNTFKFG
jgi:DNA-directed RNA polymerase subunit M/transcription elongation factor TFIIS